MSQTNLVEVNRYGFSADSLAAIQENAYATNHWPLVYILSDGSEPKASGRNDAKRNAYVGETTDTLTRLGTHLKHPHKKLLTTVHLISSERFNKSATLDIESSLIKYMAADGCFRLLNGNLGLADHNYFQKDDLYSVIFRETWDKLRAQGVAAHSLEAIDNSDVFKYSPYKSLSPDQRKGLLEIMRALLNPELKNLVVEGGAGTGKSVLAIFLFKLIHTDDTTLDLREFSEEEAELRELLAKFKVLYPKPRMALVVPMASFRKTLEKAFENIAGLHANMVISPSKLARQDYDLVLVDESHRLRKRTNLGSYYAAFDKACAALGLDKKTCSEVDWVIQQSKKAVFFYDSDQTIKPSDANAADFQAVKSSPGSKVMTLVSQFRVQGGQHYVEFIDDLLNVRLPERETFQSKRYEFLVFDRIQDLVAEIRQRDQTYGLARLIAGYAWPWVSKKEPNLFDIEIADVLLRWNSINVDWINSPNAINEVGCIHTTQGYDLNYAGIIFGREIRYDVGRDQIIIDKAHYYDLNGKQTIGDPDELKRYILNIYKTIMLRGIKGTFVYACDEGLRNYLKQHIPVYKSNVVALTRPAEKLVPYGNAVPVYDLQAAAGGFSELQHVKHEDWVAVPPGKPVGKDVFACRVIGESMNRIIPNGAMCLFRLDRGGSRNGKIVLVECDDVQDHDSGSRYTVKEYQSIKTEDADGWRHERILLKPRSYNPDMAVLDLSGDDEHRYRVVGEFLGVID